MNKTVSNLMNVHLLGIFAKLSWVCNLTLYQIFSLWVLIVFLCRFEVPFNVRHFMAFLAFFWNFWSFVVFLCLFLCLFLSFSDWTCCGSLCSMFHWIKFGKFYQIILINFKSAIFTNQQYSMSVTFKILRK